MSEAHDRAVQGMKDYAATAADRQKCPCVECSGYAQEAGVAPTAPMTTADKLRGLMEGAPKGRWYVRKSDQIWADGDVLRHVANVTAEADVTDPKLIVASVNLLPALAAVVEALVDFVDGECHCDESKGMCVQCKAQSALSALDAAVAREVG